MPEPWRRKQPAAAPQQVVGKAIQDLTAARLGRGFIPLALLGVGGFVQLVTAGFASPDGLRLVIGALATGGAMLAYGLRTVQNAFGRERKPWMSAAMLGGLVPPLFALYLLGWRGLRGLVGGGGVGGTVLAILFIATGVWVLRTWMKVVEIERLARVMSLNMDEEGGPA